MRMRMKKALSIILCISMLLGMNTAAVYAETSQAQNPETSDVQATSSGIDVYEDEANEAMMQRLPAGARPTNNRMTDVYSGYHTNPVRSSLIEVGNAQLMRVEYLTSYVEDDMVDEILVEYWDKDGNLISSRSIDRELEYYLGFYSGADAYFLVFGADNKAESRDKEVLRVVKYDKSWNRLSSCSLKNINTVTPGRSGSLRMAEYNGVLYIHTSHLLFKLPDGLNHQSNMFFEIYESDMTLKDSNTEPSWHDCGYTGHSFNQFIRIKDGVVYRVDHGDAYPRAIVLSAYAAKAGMTSGSQSKIVSIKGNIGDNYTGVAVGGFELSATDALIAYTQTTEFTKGETRNIFVNAVNLTNGNIVRNQITNYKEGSDIQCHTPFLVKTSDDSFTLLWTEETLSTGELRCAVAYLDKEGRLQSDIYQRHYLLSDCQPIVDSDGIIFWYASDKNHVYLYKLDPSKVPPEDLYADYSAVDAAIAKVPEDLSIYTGRSVSYLNYAIENVVRDLLLEEQDAVDQMANAIESAIEKLEYVDADYTGLNNAMWSAFWPMKSLEEYTEESAAALNQAYEAADKLHSGIPLKINEQEKVDAAAEALTAAIAGLEKKPIRKGWIWIENNWYYYGQNNFYKGWLYDHDRRKVYYLDPATGAMQTGWLYQNGKWYLFDNSGAMQTGWRYVGGVWYYLKMDGDMAVNEWCEGYWLNGDGSWTYPYYGQWHQDNVGWWFGDTSGWYARNGVSRISGVDYRFNASGYWVQ